MTLKQYYQKLKTKFLNDNSVCKENRDWFKQFLEYQEKKGKRSNGLPVLDDGCYRTLLSYIQRLKNVNIWFKNKPLKEMPDEEFKKEMERVYEGLEEGKIKKRNGEIFKDKSSYYSKIFKSEPFQIIGKREIAKEVIKYSVKMEKEAKFFLEEDFKKCVDTAIQLEHKCLLWALWDYGENIGAILQTTKKNYVKKINEDGEPEYLLHLRKEILKRSRTPRTEISNFPETIKFLDIVLENKKDNKKVFDFGLRQAEKMFDRCVKVTGIKNNDGSKPTLKDIRSSMACHLLDLGWTTDEIKGRLGHKSSSNVLDCYVNYKALNKRKPKKKIYEGNLKKLEAEIKELKEKEKIKDKKTEQWKNWSVKASEHMKKQDEVIERINKALKLKPLKDNF